MTTTAGEAVHSERAVRGCVVPTRSNTLVFEDPAARAVLRMVERYAPSEATVLVIGETGTGKEIVARRLHDASPRRNGPFITVNSAAISESLLESELFGHERGAYTGASHAREGWFEAANGGTIFLDEVGDLPPATQVRLLRVLQEREVVRVGSRTPIKIDVRVVAATNIDLLAAVNEGRFRQDLYFRLKVATISLPALRERPLDILPLANYFVQKFALRAGLPARQFSAEASAKLLAHDWPGNIRELENCVHRALLNSDGFLITEIDLPESLELAHPGSRVPEEERMASPLRQLEAALSALYETSTPELYQLIEDTLFRTAYAHCGENQVQTARLLGLSRNIVRARLQAINLLPEPGHRARERTGRVLDNPAHFAY